MPLEGSLFECVAALAGKSEQLRAAASDSQRLSRTYRDVLRVYRRLVAAGGERVSAGWREVTRDALEYLGGQSERSGVSIRDYDHRLYGPFLAISNEGGGAAIIRDAARGL